MKLFIPLTLLLSLLTFTALAQDKTAMDPKMQEMMAKMKAAGTPGEEQKMLAGMAGSWTYTSKWWMSPDAKPEESSGTSTMKMIMGGRYLQHETKGKAMGEKFEGLGFTGYDNVQKKYDTIWMDSMSTAIMSGKGSYDQNTKTLTIVENGKSLIKIICPTPCTPKA